VLWSMRLDREVLPRLTVAHDWPTAALGIYRFLCALGNQRARRAIAWSWGPLKNAPFLPRVREGRVVLSPALWNLTRDEIASIRNASGAERFRAVQRLRILRALPRWVGIVDDDSVLPVDFDNVLSVDSFVQLTKSWETISLVELVDSEELVVVG